jgi:hypothetical protein
VDPREAAFRPGLGEPRRGFADGDVPAFLDGIEKPGIVFADVEPIGVMGEPAAQPRLLRQHDRRDECAGQESALLQDFGDHGHALAGRRDVVANAVLGGVRPVRSDTCEDA